MEKVVIMWIPKREWVDIKRRISGIESNIKGNANEKRYEFISLYGDNEMVHQVLRISLSDRDLCKLQDQPFYSELMKFLGSLQIQKNADITLQNIEEILQRISEKYIPLEAETERPPKCWGHGGGAPGPKCSIPCPPHAEK